MNQPTIPRKKRARASDRPMPVWMLVVIAFLLLGPTVTTLCSIADDFLLHFDGVPAKDAHCSLDVYHGARNDWTTLVASYVIADGSRHVRSESLLFGAWPRNPDASVPCEIRYSPTSPDRYGTSWGFSRLPSRLASFLLIQSWFMLGGLVALGALVVRACRRLSRKRVST